jgi:hypothetical protein
MSMIGEYRRITSGQLYDLQEALRRDPYAVSAFLHPEGRSYDKPDPRLRIGKAWHGVHFLLNGKPWEGEPPLVSAVLGGTEIGDDLGYGAVRYLTPEQVREVAAALNEVEEVDLRSRFDASRFAAANIYPRGWERSDQSTQDWLWEAFVSVRAFFADAAYFGDVMLLYLS